MPKRGRPLHSNSKALVVGTTADYIDWIRHKCPERTVFLTDPLIRQRAREPKPAPHEEILCDLADYSQANEILKDHLQTWKFSLDGIISYDCESMELAAVLAENFSLSYPSVKAIQNCRNKHTSKSLWHQSGINCPRARPVTCVRDAMDFIEEIGGPCVLKPARGSGGELQFRLENAQDCERHFHDIVNGLRNRLGNRLYASPPVEAPLILAEEYIPGEEFSCDFLMENNHVNVIRLSRKILDKTIY